MVSQYSQRSLTPLKGCCTSIDCIAKLATNNLTKMKKERSKIETEKMKEAIKTIADWKKDLETVINWIVREIDKDQDCISHPEHSNFLRFDAGHCFSVKSHSDIRFNLHNIHKQNSEANQRHGGDANYINGLIKRYGEDYTKMVLGLPLKYKGIGKEKFKIQNIKNEYLPKAREVKRLMQKGQTFTRDEVNQIIGIYK